MDIADSVQSITGPLWSPLLCAPETSQRGEDGKTEGESDKENEREETKEGEQKRAYKGEKEEGLTLKRDDVKGENRGWDRIQNWMEAMNEVWLMKGLSVSQFLTLMAPGASPQEG